MSPWAKHKLDILSEYFGFYVTALKNKNFNLVYIVLLLVPKNLEFEVPKRKM